MSKKYLRGISRDESKASIEIPRLRFDDFAYISEVSGPEALSARETRPRTRASWSFTSRSTVGSAAASTAGSEVSHRSASPSTASVSVGSSPIEPPASGILKTMEFKLSYEARVWTGQGRAKRQEELLRPCALGGMRRYTSDEVTVPHDGLSPLSAEFDLVDGFYMSKFRHSAPAEANWAWREDEDDREEKDGEEDENTPAEEEAAKKGGR
ncbi:hypothetical protein C8035_v008201 [Colletotrichum spinosum]|uniref:Uncharacterized protein n=1 Tax=Colletotrichum spinosum TaxID=1347390 RepID=A0A4R8QE43_9PEZI|nr:hypothetical protein C8035_v008201 [Colletotrichum spinosum]